MKKVCVIWTSFSTEEKAFNLPTEKGVIRAVETPLKELFPLISGKIHEPLSKDHRAKMNTKRELIQLNSSIFHRHAQGNTCTSRNWIS